MKQITVHVPDNMNLDECQKVLAAVLAKAGHPNCYSGYKTTFESADSQTMILVADKDHKTVREVG